MNSDAESAELAFSFPFLFSLFVSMSLDPGSPNESAYTSSNVRTNVACLARLFIFSGWTSEKVCRMCRERSKHPSSRAGSRVPKIRRVLFFYM